MNAIVPEKPKKGPACPDFSSGPCAKRPGWTVKVLENALTGRSHRSKPGKAKLAEAIDLTREVLGIPDDYRIGIVPASDTGAVEMALWSLLGARGIDMLAWESFGKGWVTDVAKQLKLGVNILDADYGKLPDLKMVNFANDVVFTWNGTTSGVRVPNGNWIPADRQGLTICDATSAAFAMDLPWNLLDVTTWSWQKCLGGEGAHGMIVLSPRAVKRLETFTPSNRPLPKIFRLTKGGNLIDGIFRGETINTPSMIAVEDALDGLKWAQSIGLQGLINRSEDNLTVVDEWVEVSDWAAFLAEVPETISNTSVCLQIKDEWFLGLNGDQQAVFAKRMVALLDAEGVAFDIGAYRDAPAGLRIWCGPTVEIDDVIVLMPWLDWAFATAKAEFETA